MRNVTRYTVIVIAAALAAMLMDISPSYARPGGGGRGPSGPSLNRGGGPRVQGGPTEALGAGQDTRSRDRNPAPGAHTGPNPPAGAGGQQSHSVLRSGTGGPNGPGSHHSHSSPPGAHHRGRQWHQNHAAHANWPAHANRAPRAARAWWSQYYAGPPPFSPAWYASHPNAWHYHHPHADVWAVATTAAVAQWLGWAYYQPPASYSTTVIYESPDEPVEVYVDASPSDAALPTGEWLPLGVYSLVPAPDQPSTQLVQLAVDRQGALQGVYYDVLTNTSHNVSGQIDPTTRQALWALESNPDLAFRTGLDQLTQPQGVVEVALPGGVQQWQLVRMQDADR